MADLHATSEPSDQNKKRLLLVVLVMFVGLSTVVGIMVVVVLTGGLFFVGAATEGQYVEAQDQTVRMQLANIESTLAVYHAQNGTYPNTLDEIADLLPGHDLLTDVWGAPFQYSQQPACGYDISLSSMGPDGLPGTEDDSG